MKEKEWVNLITRHSQYRDMFEFFEKDIEEEFKPELEKIREYFNKMVKKIYNDNLKSTKVRLELIIETKDLPIEGQSKEKPPTGN